MDKLDYPALLKNILARHVELCNRRPNQDVENFLVIDENSHNYIWMNVGWQKGDRINGFTIYARIRDGKFWIEEDWTEEGIANELINAGVPKQDIVLAFHSPKMRSHTDFAIA